MLKKFKLSYNFDFILNTLYKGYSCGATIKFKDQPSLVEDYNVFNGLPKTYNEHNTLHYRKHWNLKLFNLKNLQSQTGIEIHDVATLIQPPGNTLVAHRDKHYGSTDKYGDKNYIRTTIFLENWKVGHILQYESNNHWTNLSHWEAGDGVMWDQTHFHLSSNAGFEDKITLQISGIFKEK